MLHAEPVMEYWLDILCFGSIEEKQELFLKGAMLHNPLKIPFLVIDLSKKYQSVQFLINNPLISLWFDYIVVRFMKRSIQV